MTPTPEEVAALIDELTAWHKCEWNHVIELRKQAAAALTALQARANAAEAKLDQIDALCKDAIRMCNDGHPVSAKNLALAICKIKGPTT